MWDMLGQVYPAFSRVLQEKLLKKGNKNSEYLKSRICYLDIFDSVNFIFFFNSSAS